jgi:hypothetical protein
MSLHRPLVLLPASMNDLQGNQTNQTNHFSLINQVSEIDQNMESSAVYKVLNTFELLGEIVSHLPKEDTVKAALIARIRRNVVLETPSIKKSTSPYKRGTVLVEESRTVAYRKRELRSNTLGPEQPPLVHPRHLRRTLPPCSHVGHKHSSSCLLLGPKEYS